MAPSRICPPKFQAFEIIPPQTNAFQEGNCIRCYSNRGSCSTSTSSSNEVTNRPSNLRLCLEPRKMPCSQLLRSAHFPFPSQQSSLKSSRYPSFAFPSSFRARSWFEPLRRTRRSRPSSQFRCLGFEFCPRGMIRTSPFFLSFPLSFGS